MSNKENKTVKLEEPIEKPIKTNFINTRKSRRLQNLEPEYEGTIQMYYNNKKIKKIQFINFLYAPILILYIFFAKSYLVDAIFLLILVK